VIHHQRKVREEHARVKAGLKNYIVEEATTDFEGKAQFQNIKPGIYYLYGHVHLGIFSSQFWNLKVTLNPGVNSLILDNENSDYF
jgi:hypothetical protein